MNIKKKEIFHIYPLGYIRREKKQIFLEINDNYIPALKGIDNFSHIQIFWWLNKFDNEKYRQRLRCHPPYNAPETGIFACRSPIRPNPIALTTAKILNVDFENGIIYINNIDAHKDTPIIDIKGYFPSCDRVKNPKVPEWASNWSQWYPEEGLSPKD